MQTELASELSFSIAANLGSDAPLLVPGMKVWFDPRNYVADMTLPNSPTTLEISECRSRAGSLVGAKYVQGSNTNRPLLVTSAAVLNNKPAIQFDGVDNYFDVNDQNSWKFQHEGAGWSSFKVFWIDSTGGATQNFSQTCNGTTAEVGVLEQYQAAAVSLRVTNGAGAVLNEWALNTAAHYAKDVARWHMRGYVDGTQHSRVSGSSLSNADAGGQNPSNANPTRLRRVGASPGATSPFKGLLGAEIHYDHILTDAELYGILVPWAVREFGVTA